MKTKKVLIATLLVPSLLINQNVAHADNLENSNKSMAVIKENVSNEEISENNKIINENVNNEVSNKNIENNEIINKNVNNEVSNKNIENNEILNESVNNKEISENNQVSNNKVSNKNIENNEVLNKSVKKEKLEPVENNTESDKQINITNSTPSEEEVKDYWHNYESKGENKENYKGVELSSQKEENIYKVKPNLKTKEKGSLKQTVIDDTIHVLNTFRYSMGLDPVEEDKELSKKAQAGAFINYANNKISHYPKTPEGFSDKDQVVKDGKLANSESNLGQGYKIYDTIGGYMDDEDPHNNRVVGHRKWLMNPFLKRVGIGQVGIFNNIYVADDNAISFNNDNIVTYPTKVNFAEFINPITPFSVNFGRDYKIENIDNVKVVVTDKSGYTKTYTKGNGLFYSKSSHGNSTALVFGNKLLKEKGCEYNIKIIGLKANKKDLPIEYTSKFISINDKKKVVIPAKKIEDIAKPNKKENKPSDNKKPDEQPSIPWSKIEDNAEIIKEEKPSIPWTEIQDNAEIIEDKKPDSPSKDKEDEKESDKIIIPWEEIKDIAKPIEKEKPSDKKKEDAPSKDLKDKKISKEKDKEEFKTLEKSKEKALENKETQTETEKANNIKPISNVQTGVAGIGSLLTTLSAAIIALFKSKRK